MLQKEPKCDSCWKPQAKCACSLIVPVASRLRFVVLQHPQEARKGEGTARIVSLAMSPTIHKVGLSWPSLVKVVPGANKDRWAVLYAGALKEQAKMGDAPYLLMGAKVSAKELEGVILLDGNWKQAKTLWWRNPWLKRLSRIILNPQNPSRYTPVRKQPRKSCLSTIEAVASVVELLEGNTAASQALLNMFERHLELCGGRGKS